MVTDKVLSVVEKIAGDKFKVRIASPSADPTDFNWWVIN